jgi:hypothetical protein
MILITVSEWWMAQERPEQIFWALALVFSVLLLIQFILSLTHWDIQDEPGAESSIKKGFSLLSLRSLLAFFAFLGWTGVFTLGVGISLWLAIILGLLMGGIAMLMVGYLIFWFSQLGGGVRYATPQDNLFQTGDVFQTIPGNRGGKGRVILNIRGSRREWDAITEGRRLGLGEKILVTDILDQNTLLVTRVKEEQGV